MNDNRQTAGGNLPKQIVGDRVMSIATEEIKVPAYLQEPEINGHCYGSLRYESSQKSWVIEGEPAVVEMAKRLFPGSSGLGRGKARFPANKRNMANLNWFLLRFPLEIDNEEMFRKEREKSVRYVLKRQQILKKPEKVSPPATFQGELREFQKEGLAFLLHNERALLADQMGLGKTPTALAWLASIDAFPALIVAPPHLIRQWCAEIRKFLKIETPGQMSLDKSSDDMIHIISLYA